MLLVTLDPIGARIGGSAIRVLELARALAAAGLSVTVATPSLLSDASKQPFAVRPFDRSRPRATLRALVKDCDVVVLPMHGLFEIPFLLGSRVPLVFDLYDPVIFEVLAARNSGPARAQQRLVWMTVKILNQVLKRGDFFLCASERQRDLWLGALLSAGRILGSDPNDPALRRLVDVVPFGIPAVDPVRTDGARPRLKGGHPAISSDAFVVVWGGALWEWLDPLTPIRAVALLRDRVDVHLVFLGDRHPTPGQHMEDTAEARRLAQELDVKTRVHFLAGWIPYHERGQYLVEGDAGVTTHPMHLESHFAFRTRVMDYLWAGLPVLCTAGDVLAELVDREGLGIVVPERDASALAAAISRLAEDRAFAAGCRMRIASLRPYLTWDLAARPLVRFCAAPRRAGEDRRTLSGWLVERAELIRTALGVLTAQGPREAARRTHRLLRLGIDRWRS